MSFEHTNTQSTVTKSELFGRVKWFNNRLGYGFITTIFPSSFSQEDVQSQDIFVHHNAIKSEEDSYKYLVQGEYVQFNLVDTENTTYKVQADEVRGIYNGKLLCDVHNEQKKHSSSIHHNHSQPHHNSENRSYHNDRFAYKRDQRDREPYDRDRDNQIDRDRPRERDSEESYTRNKHSFGTYRTPGSEPRVYPENRSDEYKTPRSVRRG